MATSPPKLFQPVRVGAALLSSRIVLSPLTRLRADTKHVSLSHVKEYYGQRGSEPGTLLITEATLIAEKAGGLGNVPGVWSDEQLAAWKEVADKVHSKKSYIYLQLWALGRAANPDILKAEGNHPYVSASPVRLSTRPESQTPRALSIDEMKEYVQLYATGAVNAVHKAGFDGVEIHGANGYLLDQFLQDVTNQRTDEYGGSVENRIRFPLAVVEAVVNAVGQKRTAIRLSPWGRYGEMGMKDPVPTFSAFVTRLRDEYPDFAYIHLVEPRVDDSNDCREPPGQSNDFIRDIWRPRPLISAGGYHFSREVAIKTAEEKGDLLAYGRSFIANPDLVYKLKYDLPLTKYNRDTFYGPSTTASTGYTDYPFASRVDNREDDNKL